MRSAGGQNVRRARRRRPVATLVRLQVVAFVVLPLTSLILLIMVTGPPFSFAWPILLAHVLAPALLSYIVAWRASLEERGMTALIAIGSATAALVFGLVAWIVLYVVVAVPCGDGGC